MNKSISLLVFAFLGTTLALHAQNNPDARRIKPPRTTGQFVFKLLPKSLDRNPNVDMTVFGEVTSEGFATSIPTAANPTYYTWKSGGLRTEGGEMRGEKPPEPQAIEKHVENALKASHYLPATDEHPATVFITFSWGAMYYNQTDLITRATMVGGHRYASELSGVIRKDYTMRQVQEDVATSFERGRIHSETAINQSPLEMFAKFSPMETYKRDDEENIILLEQCQGSLYYIVISAFDEKALDEKKLVRLWRTHMTIDASGVAMADSIPVALRNFANYLGKDTGRPGTAVKPVTRKGKVDVGELEPMEFLPGSYPITTPITPPPIRY